MHIIILKIHGHSLSTDLRLHIYYFVSMFFHDLYSLQSDNNTLLREAWWVMSLLFVLEASLSGYSQHTSTCNISHIVI